MPLIYTAPSSTASTTVTSSDGVLTAVSSPSKSGVLLRAVFTGAQPPSVTFYRTGPDGVKHVVRSGDPAPLVSGTAFAYDHEARPGVAYSYTVKGASESSAVVVTLPWSGRGGWLKSVSEPSKSVRVLVGAPLPPSRASNSVTSRVLGAAAPAAAVWPRSSVESSLEVRSLSPEDRDALWDVLDTGVVRYDEAEALSRRSLYLLPGDVSEEQVGHHVGGVWTLSISVTEVDRPATGGAPLLMPGWSWVDATRGMASMAEVQAAYPTVWDMLLAGVS